MRKFLLCALVVAMYITVSAQDIEPTAFMRAMSLIPVSDRITENPILASYADYHAGLAARELSVPPNWAAIEADEDLRSLILATLPEAGPADLLQNLIEGGSEYPALLGFDFFNVGQAVEIGAPPEVGQILIGNINPAAVAAAYMARNYVVEETANGTLLCPQAGCDTGTEINLQNRNPANPFGGDIGRNEPVFTADGMLLNSPDILLLNEMMAAHSGQAISIADLPEVQAIDRALSEYEFVNAVTLINPLNYYQLSPFPPVDIVPGAETVAVNPVQEEFNSTLLPLYSSLALAATADEDGQYGLAILTFPDDVSAATAAGRIASRLATLNSTQTGEPYADSYAPFGTLEPVHLIADEPTGQSLVIVRLVGEPASPQPENGQIEFSNTPYRRIFGGVLSSDLYWLAWGNEG